MTKACSDYNCADVFFNYFIFHAEIDRFKRTTSFHAFVAVDACIHVDVVNQRNRLAHGYISRLAGCQVHLKIIGHFHGASFCTGSTAVTAIRAHILCFFSQGDLEIADKAFDFFDFSISFYFDQGLTRRVNHFWCKNSYGAVHRWKGLV